MNHQISLRLSPEEAANESVILNRVAKEARIPAADLTGYSILKRSIDARGRQVYIQLTIQYYTGNISVPNPIPHFSFRNVSSSAMSVLVIGAGPAGLFAALQLIEKGIRPIVVERGKDVKSRRRDLAKLNKEGVVNPDSNYCFGEGGAGTYSDGKLYTRSNKRGDINHILQLFVHFGAPETILYDAHPHIGTNKLPHIITSMRQQIIDCGGEVLFEKKLVDFDIENGQVTKAIFSNNDSIKADAYLLATGHSARDIFELLHKKKILIEAKPFALGVRIEHPQSLIDSIQYHCDSRSSFLPPASYSLVEQVNDKGVFSFCMCPGGIIAPAATNAGELVVNGWSPSKRNNPFANSGMVVQVELEDALKYTKNLKINTDDPLIFMHFQQMVEKNAFEAGGGKFVAPAQRMVDFSNRKTSSGLPANSYLPGLNSCDLSEVLPSFIYDRLAQGFRAFGKKMKGYFTNDAVVVATESRTSSPVRIPRNLDNLQHPQLYNLYPCGEGAGYAGGIVSAAMDGQRVANMIASSLLHS